VRSFRQLCPSEYPVPPLAGQRYRHPASSRNWPLVQSSWSVEVPPYRLDSPTLPLDLSPAVWFSLNGHGLVTFKLPAGPSLRVSPSSRVLPGRTWPAGRSRRPLSWTLLPFSAQGIEGPRFAGFACPLRSAFRVWSPSWRFAPLDPCRFCFAPAALLGFTLRSFPLPEGIRPFPVGRTHLPFLPQVYLLPKQKVGPCGPRFLGFAPSRSPLRPDACLGRRPPDAPLGFPLRGLARDSLGGISPGLLSRALSGWR